jgi:hypothetical protein
MGNKYLDQWTKCHFVGGALFRITVFPDQPILSFTLSIFIHLLTELAEKNPHPITGAPETKENSDSDMLAFLAGWVFGCYLEPLIPPYQHPLYTNLRFWLLVAAMLVSAKELLREVVITRNPILSRILY